ncbi:MAG: hypothetical protein QOJ65_1328 [Fimbriimonadaceae bacterium]|jgi:hypothetical protein|nr:hypothetical protein [Fimbriimonadaceae bacterium]
MFEDTSGRLVRSEEEAVAYIWKFIAENLVQTDRHVTDHSRDFDLFLPWLLEITSNLRVPESEEPLPIFDLEGIYMDAAWSMVMQGYLRPGPRVITGDIRDGYGKGFSFTRKGAKRFSELRLAESFQSPVLGVTASER